MVREIIILMLMFQLTGLTEDKCLEERTDYFNVLTNRHNVRITMIEQLLELDTIFFKDFKFFTLFKKN